MRKILLAEDSLDLNECYEGILNSFFENHQVSTFISGNKLIEMLSVDPTKVDLIVTDILMLNGTGIDVVKYLIQYDLSIPLLVVSGVVNENSHEFTILKEYKGVVKILNKPVTAHDFIAKLSAFNLKTPTSNSFISISKKMFEMSDQVPTNLFLKISDEKYVKVANSMSVMEDDIIEKYVKSDNEIFVKEKDIGDFFDFYIKKMSHFDYIYEDIEIESEIRMQAQTLVSVSNRFKKIGVDQKTVSIVKNMIDVNLNLIRNIKDFKSMLLKITNSGDILFEHSIATCFVVNILLRKFNLQEDIVKYKMILASLFHDLTLTEFSLDLCTTLDPLIENIEIKSDMLKKNSPSFYTHPADAASLLIGVKNLPIGADEIVMNHHELPGGHGFPRQRVGNNLSKLSLIFNTSHFFTHLMYVNGWNAEGLDKTISQMDEKFKIDGAFYSVFLELKNCFIAES